MLLRFHRDQHGVISILTVFAVLMLTALLGMVMNVGRQVDGKIRLQNAADASAYSGGVVVARGMNTLAFSNHLLYDVFALTALLREARDQHSDKYIADILSAWKKAGQIFQKSPFPKFQKLGKAIIQQAPLEQNLADAFSAWAKAVSEILLPTLEEILQQEMIPEFQRAVVKAYPDIAQQAALEAALANGRPSYGRDDLGGVLWRTSVVPVGGAGEAMRSTLAVIDPTDPGESQRMDGARTERRQLARAYLGLGPTGRFAWYERMQASWAFNWNEQVLAFFDRRAKMCQFATLWRDFTCGQLEKLLSEYPDSNLPHLIRTEQGKVSKSLINQHLDDDFTFVGVAYWNQVPTLAPRIFYNPIPASSVAFAQVRVFVPYPKLVWQSPTGRSYPPPIGGVPGAFPGLPPPGNGDSPPPPPPDTSNPQQGPSTWGVGRESVAWSWDLLNQHWTVQLVPAVYWRVPEILNTPPNVPGFSPQRYRLPNLSGLPMDQIGRINTH